MVNTLFYLEGGAADIENHIEEMEFWMTCYFNPVRCVIFQALQSC